MLEVFTIYFLQNNPSCKFVNGRQSLSRVEIQPSQAGTSFIKVHPMENKRK